MTTDSKSQKLFKKIKRKYKKYRRRCRAQRTRIQQLESQLEKVRTGLTCPICVDYLCHPQMLPCGHTFCYLCIYEWFQSIRADAKPCECPICRQRVRVEPASNFQLCTQIDTALEETAASIKEKQNARFIESEKLMKERQADLWNGLNFNATVYDISDGTRRCIECLWEVVDGECVNCGRCCSVHESEADGESDQFSHGSPDEEMDEEDRNFIDDEALEDFVTDEEREIMPYPTSSDEERYGIKLMGLSDVEAMNDDEIEEMAQAAELMNAQRKKRARIVDSDTDDCL